MVDPFKIAIVYNPFLKENEQEAKEVAKALKDYDNFAFLMKAEKTLIEQLQKEKVSFVFNIARNSHDKSLNVSIASISELFEINLIGSNTYALSIANDKNMMFTILKYDSVPVIKDVNVNKLQDILDFYLLKDDKSYIFFNRLPNMDINDDVLKKIYILCEKAFKSLHCSDYCQFQFYIDKQATVYLTAVNPMPIFTSQGNFFKSVNIHGIDYSSFINMIVLSSAIRYKLNLSEKYKKLKANFESRINTAMK